MSKTIEPGTTVTDDRGSEYRYGGADSERSSVYSISYDMRHGGLPTITCDAERVAPSAELGELNKKDPRIIVVNDKAGRPGTWAGQWRANTTLEAFPHWHKTKTEAVEHAARRLAIADWHNDTERA